MSDTDTSDQYLILSIGPHYFAANVKSIQDVIRQGKTTPVPLSKDNISGLMNLRGHIVTEINVAKTMGIKESKFDSQGFAVVTSIKDEFYSLQFSAIGDVIEIKKKQIAPLPETIQKRWHEVSIGVHQRPQHLLIILDLKTLIQTLVQSRPEKNSIIKDISQ